MSFDSIYEKQDGLKKAFWCGVKDSTVIVTTRLEKVALIMAALLVHHMGGIFAVRKYWEGDSEEMWGSKGTWKS